MGELQVGWGPGLAPAALEPPALQAGLRMQMPTRLEFPPCCPSARGPHHMCPPPLHTVQLNGPSRQQENAAGSSGQAHARLLDWVWRYFADVEAAAAGRDSQAACGGPCQPAGAGSGRSREGPPPQSTSSSLQQPAGAGASWQQEAKRQRTAEAGEPGTCRATPGAGQPPGQQEPGNGLLLHGSGGGPMQQQPQQQRQPRGGAQVVRTARPPLYFQHEGHSRTIVGIERRVQQGKRAHVHACVVHVCVWWGWL